MIYLDSAATTFQKPRAVREAVLYAMEHYSSLGRGGYGAAGAAAEAVYDCRCAVAELFHMKNEENVIFTQNATHGLNIAIHSLINSGDEVVVSGYEHNAVTRPLRAIPNVRMKLARAPLFSPEATLNAFRSAITEETRAVVCTNVSNVFGDVLPIEEIAALARGKRIPLIVDASQSAGIVPLDAEALGADFIAMPGHKGLYGPQGTGVLLVKEGAATLPLLHGGTGILSKEPLMPLALPERLEAGTQNVAGIAGLLEGVRFVTEQGDRIRRHERELLDLTAEGLSAMRRVCIFYTPDLQRQAAVLSFTVAGEESEAVAGYLAENGVAVRAGLHCAPIAHGTVGTEGSGTVRVSFSRFNTRRECVNFLKILKKKYA